ncbi:MAG: LysR family transcriptional regulator [Sandaracinaceae bacterium]|nr:LysR family transcriptional regulator [Sandaracinaceae bacterium]
MTTTADLALVATFVEVVRQGSFTKAADRLGMPKSTVSRHVSRLEEALGLPLLVRTTRQLRLTEEGRAYHARVAPALFEVEDAARALHEGQDEPRGLLRVTVPPDIDAIGAVVAQYVARYPAVQVEVNVTNDKVDLVAGGYDLAIRAGTLADSSLVARKLAGSTFRLFASRAYLAEHGEPARVADLASHRCLPFRGQRVTWRLEGPSGVTEAVDVTGPASSDDLLFLRSLVVAGAGIGLLPCVVFRGADLEQVAWVLPDWSFTAGAVYAVYPAMHAVPVKVRAFADLLATQLRDEPVPPPFAGGRMTK